MPRSCTSSPGLCKTDSGDFVASRAAGVGAWLPRSDILRGAAIKAGASRVRAFPEQSASPRARGAMRSMQSLRFTPAAWLGAMSGPWDATCVPPSVLT